MTASFFESIADAQVSAPVKSRMKGVETRRRNRDAKAAEFERDEEEKEILWSRYQKARKAEVEALLAGAHGKEIKSLVRFLRTMSLTSAPALVTFIKRAAWVQNLDKAERALVWSIVFRGISRLRERNGLSFWDDSIDGTSKAFDEIEAAL